MIGAKNVQIYLPTYTCPYNMYSNIYYLYVLIIYNTGSYIYIQQYYYVLPTHYETTGKIMLTCTTPAMKGKICIYRYCSHRISFINVSISGWRDPLCHGNGHKIIIWYYVLHIILLYCIPVTVQRPHHPSSSERRSGRILNCYSSN